MNELILDFIGFGLVLLIPMALTIGFLYLKDRYDKRIYQKGFHDATMYALETFLKGDRNEN